MFTETFAQHRYVCVPMETRGLVAEWDRWTGQLEVVIAGQGVHVPRLFFSRMLGIPEDDIRVIMGDVGGSFGQKAFPQREDQAVVVAAVILGDRPVKWIEDRAENLISGGHAREESLQITAATDEQRRAAGRQGPPHRERGRLPGREQRPDGGGVGVGMFPGPYHWSGPGSVAYSGQAVYTNTVRALRLPGAVDDGDHRPGADGRRHRAAARHRPAGVPPPQRDLPRRAALHQRLLGPVRRHQPGRDASSRRAELIGYEQFRKDQEQARAEGRLVGIGLSLYIEPQRG